MAHTTLIDEQQSLLSDYLRSVTTYIQIQRAAETQFKQEIAAVDETLIKSNQQADTLWNRIKKTHQDAAALLKKGGWQRVLTSMKALPPGPQTKSQLSSEMSHCAEEAERAFSELRTRLVLYSGYPQSIRWHSTSIYLLIGLLVGVIAFLCSLLFANPGVAFLVGMVLGGIVGGFLYLVKAFPLPLFQPNTGIRSGSKETKSSMSGRSLNTRQNTNTRSRPARVRSINKWPGCFRILRTSIRQQRVFRPPGQSLVGATGFQLHPKHSLRWFSSANSLLQRGSILLHHLPSFRFPVKGR